MDTPRAPHHEHGSTASSLKRMRTVSDAVEMERAMRHEAQEARRTAEIELQEVSAELNLLLEAASDGTDIGHDPCPRCGYHVVANPELPAGHAPTLTTCCPYCGSTCRTVATFAASVACARPATRPVRSQLACRCASRHSSSQRAGASRCRSCSAMSCSSNQCSREAVLQMAELRDAWFHALNYVDAGEEYR